MQFAVLLPKPVLAALASLVRRLKYLVNGRIKRLGVTVEKGLGLLVDLAGVHFELAYFGLQFVDEDDGVVVGLFGVLGPLPH